MQVLRKTIFSLVILISIILSGCTQSDQISVIKTDEVLITDAKEIKNFSTDWVKELSDLPYTFSIASNDKIITLIFNRNNNWFYKEYRITNGDIIKIKPSDGQLTYASLPANRTITYSWYVNKNQNSQNNELTSYDNWIHIPFNNSTESEGEDYDRQIFDLSPTNSSIQINFIYKSMNNNSSDTFIFEIQNN